jgi:hypothetical protein
LKRDLVPQMMRPLPVMPWAHFQDEVQSFCVTSCV